MINIKILVACGHGLGSSFMVEMNIQEVFRQFNAPSDIETEHSNIMIVSPKMADLFICGKDLAKNAGRLGDVLVLDNISDKAKSQQKFSKRSQQLNMV